MKNRSLLSAPVLVVGLLLAGCSTGINPVEPLEPLPVPTTNSSSPAPSADSKPVIEITGEEEATLNAFLQKYGDQWDIDLVSLTEVASAKPIDLSINDAKDYVEITYNLEDLDEETFVSWMEAQIWSEDWVTYVPSEVDKIWGFENSLGKESPDKGLVVFDSSEDRSRITIMEY